MLFAESKLTCRPTHSYLNLQFKIAKLNLDANNRLHYQLDCSNEPNYPKYHQFKSNVNPTKFYQNKPNDHPI